MLIPVAVMAAAPIYSSTLVFDDFDTLPLRPDPAAYWHVLNSGDNWQEADYDSDSTSVTVQTEDGTSFVSLANHPDATPGNYANAELAELWTGQQALQPGNWSPTKGHPVTFEVRARWSEDYTLTGGTAVGTSGIWLWNSPVGTTGVAPTTSFGWIWAQPGTAFNMGGLNMSIIRGQVVSAPVYSKPVTGIDMNEWNTFTIVWSAGPGPNETLVYSINGVEVGRHITKPLGSLSVEIWNDNQVSTTTGITFHNPPSTQTMDIDYIRIEQ